MHTHLTDSNFWTTNHSRMKANIRPSLYTVEKDVIFFLARHGALNMCTRSSPLTSI